MALSAAAAFLGGGLGSALNGLMGQSNAMMNNATNIMTAPISNSNSWGMSTGISSGGSYNQGYSEGYTAGQEASAADIQRAREANEMQLKMSQMQMDYNAAEAKANRDWQEYMSNTSYQRAMEDLRRAGLNPILAAGNLGASTPNGAYASAGMPVAFKANTIADQRNISTSSGGSHESTRQGSINRSTSKTEPSYIKAGGSIASAIANAINAGSASSIAQQKYNIGTSNQDLINAMWGAG